MSGLGLWVGGAALLAAKFTLVLGLSAGQPAKSEDIALIEAQHHVIAHQIDAAQLRQTC